LDRTSGMLIVRFRGVGAVVDMSLPLLRPPCGRPGNGWIKRRWKKRKILGDFA